MGKLCIIPARVGSKRIPKKNIKYFLGKPIIAYSIEAAINNNYSTVVPVLKYTYPIQRSLRVVDGLLKFREEKHINTRSQDLEKNFHDSDQFYWLNTESFLMEKKIFNDNTGYVELKEYEA